MKKLLGLLLFLGLTTSASADGMLSGCAFPFCMSTMTSAQFAGAISDETGSGLVVLNNGPTFSTGTVTLPDGTTFGSASISFQTGFSVTTHGISSIGSLVATSASGFEALNQAATATVPTLMPNRASLTTGLGAQASGNMSLIAGGVEIMRMISTGPLAITLPTDAATTDNTMCINTTTHIMSSGSGTLGICLGTSSKRFKYGIHPVTDGLSQIMNLKPDNFYYLSGYGDGGKREQYGFIAEDVVTILPKLVGLDKAGKPLNVDLVGMIPILVKAIQEQQIEIQKLKNRK